MKRHATFYACIEGEHHIPEQGLLAGVLRRALIDLKYKDLRREAIYWFTSRKSYFDNNEGNSPAIGYQDCIDGLNLSVMQLKAIDTVINYMIRGFDKSKGEIEDELDAATKGQEGRKGGCEIVELALSWLQSTKNSTVLR